MSRAVVSPIQSDRFARRSCADSKQSGFPKWRVAESAAMQRIAFRFAMHAGYRCRPVAGVSGRMGGEAGLSFAGFCRREQLVRSVVVTEA